MTQETPGAPVIRQLEKDIAAWKGRKARRKSIDRIRFMLIVLISLLLVILLKTGHARLPW